MLVDLVELNHLLDCVEGEVDIAIPPRAARLSLKEVAVVVGEALAEPILGRLNRRLCSSSLRVAHVSSQFDAWTRDRLLVRATETVAPDFTLRLQDDASW